MKCIEDEIPFELPKGWSWCRYSNVIELYSGQDLPPNKYNDVSKGIPYITGASNLDHGKIIINRWTTTPTTHATAGDLLLTVKGSGVGKMAFCDIDDAHIARQIMALRCTNAIVPQFLYIAISAMLSDIISQANGIIPGIRREIVLETLLPLPPFHEQERISERANSSLCIINTIDDDRTDLWKFIQNIKSRILDLAIRGKLVPQDPNDEPASVLLKRIRAEKEKLIKQGKIKRDKKESVIFKGDDNSYYQDLPQNWQVTTLRELTTAITLNDGDWILSKNMTTDGEIKLLQLGSIGNMVYIDKGFKYLTQNTFDELSCTEIYSGYLLINRIISDKMCCCIVPDIDGTIITTVDTCWVAPSKTSYDIKFLMYQLASPTFQNKVLLNATGTTRKRISKNNLIDLNLFLPPLAEQKRIVVAIEAIFTKLDEIATQIA